jgi:hypothetical protein
LTPSAPMIITHPHEGEDPRLQGRRVASSNRCRRDKPTTSLDATACAGCAAIKARIHRSSGGRSRQKKPSPILMAGRSRYRARHSLGKAAHAMIIGSRTQKADAAVCELKKPAHNARESDGESWCRHRRHRPADGPRYQLSTHESVPHAGKARFDRRTVPLVPPRAGTVQLPQKVQPGNARVPRRVARRSSTAFRRRLRRFSAAGRQISATFSSPPTARSPRPVVELVGSGHVGWRRPHRKLRSGQALTSIPIQINRRHSFRPASDRQPGDH